MRFRWQERLRNAWWRFLSSRIEDTGIEPEPRPHQERVSEVDPNQCPKCGQGHLAEYYYGLPPMEADGKMSVEIRSRIAAGYLVLGGCIIVGDEPDWHCPRCNTDFFVEPNQSREMSIHAKTE